MPQLTEAELKKQLDCGNFCEGLFLLWSREVYDREIYAAFS